jgi:hypothetical protein
VSHDILALDVRTKQATRSDMGADLSSSLGKWVGGALGVDGCIYCAPYGATAILKINPITGVATTSTMGGGAFGGNSSKGMVAGHNGKLYGIPGSSGNILQIDPVAGTAVQSKLGATIGGGGAPQYSGGAVGPDGKIYCAPLVSGTSVLIIDPTTNTATNSTYGGAVTGSYSGAVTAASGKIYFLPAGATTTVMVLDTVADSVSFITIAGGVTGRSDGGCLGPDGKIYSCGGGATDWLIIDPVAGTAARSVLGEAPVPCVTIGGSVGCISAGRAIYGAVTASPAIWTITGFKKGFPWHLARSNYLNKF